MLVSAIMGEPPVQPPAPRVVRISGSVAGGAARPSDRTAEIGLRFGLPLEGGSLWGGSPLRGGCFAADPAAKQTGIPGCGGRVLFRNLAISLSPGTVVMLVGPSGCGKTSALAEIERTLHGACVVGRAGFPTDTAIIDRIAPGASLAEAVRHLTACGLSQPSLWLRSFDQLSEGERFRARLARATAMLADAAPSAVLLCDEFCSGVHHRLARAIAFAFGKLVARSGFCAIVACHDEALACDLHPRVVARLRGDGGHEIHTLPAVGTRVSSLRRRLRIEPGGKGDYQRFAAMHYRATDELGFVDKVFVLREGAGGEPLGIVVYSYPPLELALRNQATQNRFCRNPALLNRCMRIVRRLVIHPDVRGCGLGHFLLRQTLPRVGTEFVECLASLGEFNPVCEKAGMQRIGQCALPAETQAALEALRSPAGRAVDPLSWDFVDQVGSSPRVRAIVAKVVYEWYASTTGGGRHRVERQSAEFLARAFRGLIASRPTYYLWKRGPKRQKPFDDVDSVSRRDASPEGGHSTARAARRGEDSERAYATKVVADRHNPAP